MKSNLKKILKTIGLVASYLPFAAITLFSMMMLDSGNRLFLNYPHPDSIISATMVDRVLTIATYVVSVLIFAAAVFSFLFRSNKRLNQAFLWGSGAFALLYAIFFPVMGVLSAQVPFGWNNLNLYLTYFLFGALACAVVIYSAIRNLIKIQKSGVTFAPADRLKTENGDSPQPEQPTDPENQDQPQD